MSRPLELTVHERCYCEMDSEPHYAGEQGLAVFFADDQAYHKRLTDAECAAEFWHSWSLLKTGSSGPRDWTEYDRTVILRRFATTPHYTEAGGEPS